MPNILMPALSPTMEEGKLSKWLVKEGDTVNPGDVLAEIETDKATMEVESVDSGKVSKILVPEGTEGVKVNTPIALVLGEGETPGEAAPKPAVAPAVAPTSAQAASQASMVTAEAPVQPPKAEAAATAPAFQPAADPDLPDGVEMVEMTVRQALNEALAEEMRRDETVFLMGEEVAEYNGAYKVSQGLLDEFGARRVIDTPITEHAFAGLGIGAAFAGLRPIIEFMTWNFAMQAIDQTVNSAAKQLYMSGGQVHAPIVFRGPNGAASRVGAQHSQDYSAWYSHVPGLYVIAPYSAADAKGLLKAAIRSNNPVVFLENEILYGATGLVPKLDDYVLPIGKARTVRQGRNVTIVSFSMGMRYATQATEKLVAQGVDVELIDLRTLRPLDAETVINSVKKTGRIVTVEEGWPQSGIGAELAARVVAEAFDYLDAPPTRVTGKDVPMPYAANLEKLALPSVDEVIAAVNAVTYRGVGAMPRATYADVEAAPENLVAEIINGELMTHPRPSFRHGATATALQVSLGAPFQYGRGGPGGWIFVVETEFKFGDDLLVPDVAGWRVEHFPGEPERNYFTSRPDWVCEILLGSTEKRDRTLKMDIYAAAGIPHMWLIDPRLQLLEAFEIRDGIWGKIGNWNSADEVRAAPFHAISFSLADLWPLDRPLGFNESPQALYAGDR